MTRPLTPVVRDAALGAAAMAALTLPDPARLDPRQRHLVRLGSTAVVGWLGSRASRAGGLPFVSPGVFGAVAGAAASLALSPAEEAVDRWLAGRLRRAGLQHPRPVMAVVAAGLGALAWVADAEALAEGEDQWVDAADLYEERPLDLALREIVVAALAAGPDRTASAVLTRQLEAARAQTLGEDFESTVMLVVDEEAELAVPHTQSWPVRARWEIEGHPVELTVQVHRGRLDHVALMPVEDEGAAEIDLEEGSVVDDPGNDWPDLAEVTLVVETADGLLPVG